MATLCYNYFFFPPLYTFTIHEAANWVALAAFLVTSVVVSRLVIAARIQAERAEQRRNELETLYAERERFIERHAHVQALRESETLKTSLLRAISHDLTTPLTAITIHTRSAAAEGGDTIDELKSSVAGIADETGRLRRRIDNLLSMARLEAGKAKPRREPTPPADLFRAVRENLPLVFESRPVTVHVDDDCPDANVDPSLALEILVNLIENAHRVSPPDAPLELVARSHPLDPRAGAASKSSTAGRACRPASRTPTAIFLPARRATWRNAASDWRSRAASPPRTAAASASRRGRAAARSRALDVPAAPLPAGGACHDHRAGDSRRR